MPNVSFVVRDPSSKIPSPIRMLYTCSDGRLRYYIGRSVLPSLWPNKIDIVTKKLMNKIRAHVEQLASNYLIEGSPLTMGMLKESLAKLLNKKNVAYPDNMFDAMTQVVENMQAGNLLTPQKKKYSSGSIKTFNFTINLLKEFDPRLSISAITMDTYHRFIRWMHQKNYSTNYIGSQIKNWKSLGKMIGNNPVFTGGQFKKIQEDTFDIYLDEKELEAIYRYDGYSPRQQLVRDWFILDCYTGLRVSDLKLLKDHNYSNGFITIANEKTDVRVVIPCHPYVDEILARNNGFPPRVCDGEINKVIKGVAQLAGITGDILFTITKGGQRHDEYMQKWEMVSCHTARRSFITNCRKNGVPDSLVMKMTGISSAATLKRYDKLTADEAARIAADHTFFKRQSDAILGLTQQP